MNKALLQNRPIALTLIAAAFLFSGLQSFFNMLVSLFEGRISIDPGFVLVPGGIGLLCLSNGWRKFALVCLVLVAILLYGLGMFEFVRPGQLNLRWNGQQFHGAARLFALVSLVLVGGSLVCWAILTLTSPDIVRLFSRDSKPPTAVATRPESPPLVNG